MEKDFLTVKEYAEIRGCTTQYVYKLLQTTLQPFATIVENRKCLKIEVLNELSATQVANFATNKVANFATNSTNQVATNDAELIPSSTSENTEIQRINKRNEEIIDDLRQELKSKDEQIKQQSEHIIELSAKIAELFENNQHLQLNYQYLLTNGNTPQNEDINVQSASAEETSETISEPKNKGFFSRFFK